MLIKGDTYTFEYVGAPSSRESLGYSVAITGAPEINTWAMMIAGFSALAFAGYRRRGVAE